MSNYSSILEDLKTENNHAFGNLYKNHFAAVQRFVLRNSGSADDAEDLFQDTMIVLTQKLRLDNFILSSSVKTYIMAIAKNLWFKKLRDTKQETRLTPLLEETFYEELNLFIEQERTYTDKLYHYFHKITAHCKGLIHDMFFKNKSIEQIQEKYKYSSIHNAQNQKHKCVEQIRRVKEQEKSKN